jgi:hypothetical protein
MCRFISGRGHVAAKKKLNTVNRLLNVGALKWSGKFGQRAKMYPTRTNGYENDEATELFRQF